VTCSGPQPVLGRTDQQKQQPTLQQADAGTLDFQRTQPRDE